MSDNPIQRLKTLIKNPLKNNPLKVKGKILNQHSILLLKHLNKLIKILQMQDQNQEVIIN